MKYSFTRWKQAEIWKLWHWGCWFYKCMLWRNRGLVQLCKLGGEQFLGWTLWTCCLHWQCGENTTHVLMAFNLYSITVIMLCIHPLWIHDPQNSHSLTSKMHVLGSIILFEYNLMHLYWICSFLGLCWRACSAYWWGCCYCNAYWSQCTYCFWKQIEGKSYVPCLWLLQA